MILSLRTIASYLPGIHSPGPIRLSPPAILPHLHAHLNSHFACVRGQSFPLSHPITPSLSLSSLPPLSYPSLPFLLAAGRERPEDRTWRAPLASAEFISYATLPARYPFSPLLRSIFSRIPRIFRPPQNHARESSRTRSEMVTIASEKTFEHPELTKIQRSYNMGDGFLL